ncbi:MAG: hypothetical protein U0324_03450 [Polyangiales bacterium]
MRTPPALLTAALLAAAPLAAQPRREPDVRVTAELVERGPAAPHCGIMHVLVPMRYRVLTSEGAALRAGDEVEAVVSCPEMAGVTFAVGARHRLTLAPRRPWRTGALFPWPGHPEPARRWWVRALATAP